MSNKLDLKDFFDNNVKNVPFDYFRFENQEWEPKYLPFSLFLSGIETGHIFLLGNGNFICPAFYGYKKENGGNKENDDNSSEEKGVDKTKNKDNVGKYYCYDKGDVDHLKALLKIKFSLVDNGDALITKEKIEIRNDINELEKELPNVMTEKGKYAIATTINALAKYLIDIIPKVPPKEDLLWLFKGNQEAMDLFRTICKLKGLTKGGLWKKSTTYLRKTNLVLLEAGIVRNPKNDESVLRIYSYEFNGGEMIASHGRFVKPDYGNERPELVEEIKEIFASLIEKFGTENHS